MLSFVMEITSKSLMVSRDIYHFFLIALAGACLAHSPTASAAPVLYKVYGPRGIVTFTNRAPKAGVKSEIFQAKKVSFSTFSVRSLPFRALQPEKFSAYIKEAASLHKVDEFLLRAVIHAESGFNPRAKSPKGAMGLMQLMPGTAKEVGVKNPYEPRQNIRGGASYLSTLLGRFSSLSHAIAAYNAGPQAVENYKGIPPFKETQDYVKRVTALYRAYRAKSEALRG